MYDGPVFKFLSHLLTLNSILLRKTQGLMLYDEALALHAAKKYKEAVPLMRQAAELGNPNAMGILGSMYLLGQGVPENGAIALEWLEKAVSAGGVGSSSVLGMALATGKAGVKPDITRARELLTKAAQDGDAQSAEMLGMMDARKGMFRNLR